LKEVYCRKAIYYALAAKAAPAELVKLYANLAAILTAPSEQKEKLTALQSSFSYMEANSQDKAAKAQEIAQLIDQIGTPSEDANSAALAAQALKMREAAATITTETGNYGAAAQWCQLAQNEIRTKNFDLALEHLSLALKNFKSSHGTFLSSYGLAASFFEPLSQLAAVGKTSEVEAIWSDLRTKTAETCGVNSFEYTNVLAHIFTFYARSKQTTKATETLEQILAVDPRKQELGIAQIVDSSARTLIRKTVYELAVKDNQATFAQLIAEKLVAAQRQTYGNDDLRLSMALSTLAQIELLRGNLSQSESHAREALAIARLYRFDFEQSGWGADLPAAQVLEEVLKKEAKTDEVQKLHADLAARREIRPENRSDEMLTYEWWQANGPYNYNCVNGGMRLLEEAAKRNEWRRVQELAPQCITGLAHNPQFNSDSCCPSPSPAYQKYYAFQVLIQACVAMGHMDQARQWLQRAVGEMSYRPMVEEYVFLGTCENECGNKNEALAYCRLGEKAIDDSRPSAVGIWPVKALYEKLGMNVDVDRIVAISTREAMERGEENIRNNQSILEEKATRVVAHKVPPVDDAKLVAHLEETDPSDEYYCVEPTESTVLPSEPPVANKYIFDYAAFSTEGLLLDPGASVRSRVGADSYSLGGSFNTMGASQPIHQAAGCDFLFVYDAGPGQPLTKAPPIMAKAKMLPALSAPTNANPLTSNKLLLSLNKGDYTADSATVTNMAIADGGRVRLFLKDAGAQAGSAVFLCNEDGKVNAVDLKKKPTQSPTLEIWYNGRSPIKLGKHSQFNGLIYAPNAEINLDQNVTFNGAMVGRRITAKKGSKIIYDPRYAQSGQIQ